MVQVQVKFVGIVTGEYPPQIGGVADYTFNLGQALACYGLEVEVITRQRASDCTVLNRADIKPAPTQGGQVIVPAVALLPANGFGLISCWRLFRHFRRQPYDVLIFQYVPQMYGRAGIAPYAALVPLLARLGGVATVITMFHEIKIQPSRPATNRVRDEASVGANRIRPFELAQSSRADAIRPYEKSWVKGCASCGKTRLIWLFQVMQAFFLILFSHQLVTNSNVHAAFLNKLAHTSGRKKPVAIIPVGSNIPVATTSTEKREKLRASLNLTNSGPILMIFSPFTVHKDLTICLTALEQLTEATLVCIGGNSDPARYAALQRQVEALGIDSRRLHFISGPLTSDKVSGWLQIADIYLHPAMLGASGRSGVLAAALQHGLPVIAFAGPETSATFKNGENILLIKPGDLPALISCIQNLSIDADLRQRLCTGARLLYNSTASWEIIAESFYNLITSASGFKDSGDFNRFGLSAREKRLKSPLLKRKP